MGKVEEGISILQDLGLPKGQQNERSALTLLALLDLKKRTPWQEAKQEPIRIHDILSFIEKNYQKKYAENTRETIRRQTIHRFEQAEIVIRNPDDAQRPTNSPHTRYMISNEALQVIRMYKTLRWKSGLEKFSGQKGRLAEKYQKRRKNNMIPATLPGGKKVNFSPGRHNWLQVKIIEEFIPRFCPQAEVAYIGDAASKMLHLDEQILTRLGIPLTQHDKLPDVVLFTPDKNQVLLIEAVTSHGPLSPKRKEELEHTLWECTTKKIYLSAFPDFKEFKKHMDNIAWETEIWIESNPDHLIHFNGPKFFTVYD